MNNDIGGSYPQGRVLRLCLFMVCWIALGLSIVMALFSAEAVDTFVFVTALLLLGFSAFFSSCEVAFFSLHPLRLRNMRTNGGTLEKLVANLMNHPGNLLTSILMGNCIVNVLLSITLAFPVEHFFQGFLENAFDSGGKVLGVVSYALAVFVCTAILVLFGEVGPKLAVVHRGETFSRYAAVPILVVDCILMPLRSGIIWFVGFLFRVTRFSEVLPAPFMTDEEFKLLLADGKASGAIEEEERAMIQGILEFGDVNLAEILVPRPDMIVLKEEATVGEALVLVRTHEYSRMPVYREDLDHIVGILHAKDMLPIVDRGELHEPIAPLLRKTHYVPETMSVANFVKTAQRLRAHLAIVVDEYGGTEGLVTLQGAISEVVEEIPEDDDEGEPLYKKLRVGVYQVEGNFPLDELETLTGVTVEDEEHTTVAGFLMEQTDKILEVGDQIQHANILYTIKEVDGKRVSKLLINVPPKCEQGPKQ